jgi:hypothetical protein
MSEEFAASFSSVMQVCLRREGAPDSPAKNGAVSPLTDLRSWVSRSTIDLDAAAARYSRRAKR